MKCISINERENYSLANSHIWERKHATDTFVALKVYWNAPDKICRGYVLKHTCQGSMLASQSTWCPCTPQSAKQKLQVACNTGQSEQKQIKYVHAHQWVIFQASLYNFSNWAFLVITKHFLHTLMFIMAPTCENHFKFLMAGCAWVTMRQIRLIIWACLYWNCSIQFSNESDIWKFTFSQSSIIYAQ